MCAHRRAALAGAALAGLLAACTATDDTVSPPPPPRTSSVPQASSAVPITASSSDRSAATPGTTTSGSATSGSAAPRSITVVMNGDMLLHEGLWQTARMDAERTGRGTMDFRPVLADLRPVVRSADLAICHLETPLAPRGGPFSGYPVFSVPPQILPALKWEGYDACTTASNHSLDDGFSGIQRTLGDFDRVGLAHFGTATTRKASRTPRILDVKGVQVGLIAATYGTNGIPIPSAEPWSVPIIDPTRIEQMAAKAKRRGADIVIVALHWGLEYDHAPIQDQIDVADTLTKDPDIDLIYGHHAHVVQPYDRVNGTWVVYGLGNAVAQQDADVEGVYDGNTCRVTFTEKPDGSFTVSKLEYLPTMITHFDGVHPMRWLDVPKDLHDPAFASLRPALRATQARVSADVNLLGALEHGVVEAR
jgi:poly-gamma-glutamate capsule biosynthesis protein CapA/YwtB (metallophosphatase superfamily)